ncbi:glycosyl transferase group 1 [Fibrisoma limi BUZ 3]|uniref:Glycosyl transferase group 1 n=2 Tax=Fibrisoma limi TaxID=663275 RepID=I2GT97_9BACT|nr:glycosyl transferase group 1 [Fibrisoma limi BUZ 3]
MKVLLSAYACVPYQGSEQLTGWTYASTLSMNDVEVHCLTQGDGQKVIDPILAEGLFPNLRVHYVRVPKWVDRLYYKGLFGLYFHYLYWQWQAYRTAKRLNARERYALVHHVTYGSIQLGSFMYRLKIPFIFGPVGGGQEAPAILKDYFGKYWQREQLRSLVSKLLQRLNPGFYKSLRLASRVIVTNKDTYRLTQQFRRNKPIDWVWDAGLASSFLPEEPVKRTAGNELKLLWVGRLLPRKALELTIHAFSKVNPAYPITLTVVGGSGEMSGQLTDYLSHYQVTDRVRLAGQVTFQEVRNFYREADAFIFTSLRDSCPHQLLEAMAFSLPIVTLSLHGQDELVSDSNGIKVSIQTKDQVADELAKAIEWMYTHPDERLKMGEAAYQFAKQEVWDLKIKKFVDEFYPAALATTVSEEMYVSEAK